MMISLFNIASLGLLAKLLLPLVPARIFFYNLNDDIKCLHWNIYLFI